MKKCFYQLAVRYPSGEKMCEGLFQGPFAAAQAPRLPVGEKEEYLRGVESMREGIAFLRWVADCLEVQLEPTN